MTPPFRVRLWCSDCTGIDPQGCFDGGTLILESDEAPFDPIDFPTLRAAIDAGHEAVRGGGPLEFDVLDSTGEEVEYHKMTQREIDVLRGCPSD